MRKLGEIIEVAKSGEMPTHEECYYALCALEQLSVFDMMGLRRLATDKTGFFTPTHEHEEMFNRHKAAMSKNPKEWLGPNYDWLNPVNAKRRERHIKLFNEIAEGGRIK